MARLARLLAVGAISFAVATTSIIAGTGQEVSAAPPSPGASPSNPASAPSGGGPSDPALAIAVARWITAGGEADLKALAGDFKDLEMAANADNVNGIRSSCAELGTDVKTAQVYGPIPDPAAQHSWSAALVEYAAGAADCVTGATSSNVDMIAKASTEITIGTKDLDKVTERLNEIGG